MSQYYVNTAHAGAGNPEMTDSPTGCAYYDGQGWAPWAAVTVGPYGSCTDVNFGRAVAHNASHLHYQQVSVTSRGVVDDLWIVQTKHGSFKHHHEEKEKEKEKEAEEEEEE
jgi:hypothetical protein